MSCRHPRVVCTLEGLTRRNLLNPHSGYHELLCVDCGVIYRSNSEKANAAPMAPPGWEQATLDQIRAITYP